MTSSRSVANRSVVRSLIAISALGVLVAHGRSAQAQGPGAAGAPQQSQGPGAAGVGLPSSSGPTGNPNPSSADVERARVHYERGIQLYNEENFDAALFEFERAYELAPSYKILYNMARIQRQLNNYAAALQNFRRYLNEGAAAVPDDRKKEVEKEIETLRIRVASIEIKVNVEGADVYVDDSPVCTGTMTGCVGKSPLPAPVIVNPGRRKITAQKAGYAAGATVVRVVGGDSTVAQIDLTSLAAAQRPSDPGPRNRAILSWSITGAFAAGAAVTGVLALNAQKQLKDDRGVPDIDPNTLDSDSKKVKTLSLVADVLGGVAVVGGVVSIYFTYKALKGAPEEEAPPAKTGFRPRFDVGPTGAVMSGTF